MNYLRQQFNQGNVGLVQLVTWGLGLITFAGSITYASYASNNGQISVIREKQAGQEATVVAIDKRLERIEYKLDDVLGIKTNK